MRRICNSYFFSTTKMVTRTRLSVAWTVCLLFLYTATVGLKPYLQCVCGPCSAENCVTYRRGVCWSLVWRILIAPCLTLGHQPYFLSKLTSSDVSVSFFVWLEETLVKSSIKMIRYKLLGSDSCTAQHCVTVG